MLGEVYGAWDAPEACMSSTWRELEAVNRVLKSNAESLLGAYLVLSLTDLPNTACVEISCPITEASNPTGISLVVCRLLQMYLKQERILSMLS
jgi:hypothetical protein